ncbi:MAG: 50S ribosomal protein L35 [Candidatus Levybacteria bacterium]|nr:50S ribosomal protein L35 [Candidatus Levybacteria bacterium]
MKKLKIRKSVAKRFKVTKTGKVLFTHQYGSHKKLHKSKSRIRRQKETGVLKKRFAKKIKKMLGEN